MSLYIPPSFTSESCGLFLGPSIKTCLWSVEIFVAAASVKVSPKPSAVVAAHAGLQLCWPQAGWEGRASGCPAPPLACALTARIKLLSIWSGDKPAAIYHSETWSTDSAMLCHDPHSPATPHPGTCGSLEPALSHALRKSTAEAFSEFCRIGAAPMTRLGGTEFAYSGSAGSM